MPQGISALHNSICNVQKQKSTETCTEENRPCLSFFPMACITSHLHRHRCLDSIPQLFWMDSKPFYRDFTLLPGFGSCFILLSYILVLLDYYYYYLDYNLTFVLGLKITQISFRHQSDSQIFRSSQHSAAPNRALV